MWNRRQIKESAKRSLSAAYWKSVLAALVLTISVGAVGGSSLSINLGNYLHDTHSMKDFWQVFLPFSSFSYSMHGSGLFLPGITLLIGWFLAFGCILHVILKIFVLNPLEMGGRRFFVVDRAQNGRTSTSELVSGFSVHFMNVVKTLFLRDLYLFLWSLLCVIPGIVKSYSYRMVPYIIAESPDMDQREAFRLSRSMMDGNKWRVFVYDLSFLGWWILNCLTFGILGLFYVNPYKATADAELYAQIRDEFLGRGPQEF
ncbi:MAG: DUF975 family protein [Lachnospiraceae bacterium]